MDDSRILDKVEYLFSRGVSIERHPEGFLLKTTDAEILLSDHEASWIGAQIRNSIKGDWMVNR